MNAQLDEQQEGNDEKVIRRNKPNVQDTRHQTWTKAQKTYTQTESNTEMDLQEMACKHRKML
jgi:hypothetical protein